MMSEVLQGIRMPHAFSDLMLLISIPYTVPEELVMSCSFDDAIASQCNLCTSQEICFQPGHWRSGMPSQ